MVHQDGFISKRLVSSQLSPAEQIQLVEEMLADKGEQQAAKGLKPDDASRLIELLDLVCHIPFDVINALRRIDSENRWIGYINSTYMHSVLGPSLRMAQDPSEIGADLEPRARIWTPRWRIFGSLDRKI